jgi:hypothetical protein
LKLNRRVAGSFSPPAGACLEYQNHRKWEDARGSFDP